MVKFGLMVPLVTPEPHQGSEGYGSAVRYLIPAILPERELDVDGVATKACLTFFLVFATADVLASWESRGHVTAREVRREGFFPSGVFSRILGRAVAWSQATTGSGVENMELGQGSATLSYGRHVFTLLNVNGHFVRVEVHVQTSQLTAMTLYEQTQGVLAECVSSLHCCIVVPSDGGSREGGYADYEGSLTMLYGKRGLVHMERVGEGMFVAPRERLEAEELRERFEGFLPPRGLRDNYDVFVSYRWGELDSDLASGMFTLLSQEILEGRGVQVFLDKERLQGGRNFQTDFCHALACSTLAMPLVSIAALRRMHTLHAGAEVDNLLLEWALIVELQEQGRLAACCPILLGRPLDAGEASGAEDARVMTSLFIPGGPAELPEVVCSKVRGGAAPERTRESCIMSNLAVRQVLRLTAVGGRWWRRSPLCSGSCSPRCSPRRGWRPGQCGRR